MAMRLQVSSRQDLSTFLLRLCKSGAFVPGNVLQLSYACDGKDTLVFPALAAHPPCVSRRHCMSMLINQRGYIYAGIRIANPP